MTVAIGVALVAPVIIGARRGEPIPGSTVRADSRERFTISTPQTLFSSPSVTLDRGTVALVGPDTQESSFRAALRALLTGGGADLVLDGAKLTIDRRATGDAPAPANAPAATGLPEELGSIIAALSDFKFRSLTLLDSKIVVRTVQGGAQTISVLNAEIASDAHGLVKANGRLEFRGEPLNFEAAFTRPDGKPDAPVKVRAAVNGKYVTASFDGRLANDHRQITAQNGELSVSDLRGFASWLGASWPLGSGLGLFTAKGQLTLDERAISFEHAQVTLDGNAATGALTAKIGAERPSIEGTLAFATFDVAPYTTPSRPYALALAVDWLSGLRIPGLSAPSFLRETDADIRISAGNVVSGGDRLGRGAISLSVKEGKLYGEIAELDLEHGGNGEGQFTLDMTGAEPLYTIRAELNDIDLATVVAPRLGPSIVDGAGDIRLNLNARGTSEADVMGSLAGTLSLEMNEGGRVGIDLDALSPMVTASPAASDGWGAAAMGSTTVSSFTARFTAVAGVLTANTIEATTENRTVTAAGTVDVDKNALDLVLSIAPAAGTAEAPAGAFKIQGPWSAPAISRTEPGKSAQTKPSGSDPG
ncbi:MAG TPA: AsmA-like C-terminal region-containing protein [Hyphomicrobium sp.]|nr:AsmA-like C-terminal region-containing protein [Hyphomicrobium sp.]